MTRTTILALGLAAALPSLAFAHTSFVVAKATADTGFKAVLAVPHGCDGKATEEIRIAIPEGFVGAKPMPKPGWSLAITEGQYAKAYEMHGETVSSGPVEIRWTGGALEDAWYDEFTIRGTFAGVTENERVAFPVTQICTGGVSVAWTDVAPEGTDPHSLEHPAPLIAVTVGGEDEHSAHHAAAGEKTPGKAVLGDLTIDAGFARAMLPGQKVGGGYLTIMNHGTVPDRLLSAKTPLAAAGEMHEMTMEGDVMKMRALGEGLEIPAGGTVELKPGGRHVMFTGVETPFAEGGTVPVTLTFEKAGTVELTLPVLAPSAKGPAEDHSGHAMEGMGE